MNSLLFLRKRTRVVIGVIGIIILAWVMMLGVRFFYPEKEQLVLQGSSLGTLYVSMAKKPTGNFQMDGTIASYTYTPGATSTSFHSLMDLGPIPVLQTKVVNREGDMFFVYAPKEPLFASSPQSTEVGSTSTPDIATLTNYFAGASNIGFTNYFTGGIENVLPGSTMLYGQRSLAWSSVSKLLAFTARDRMAELAIAAEAPEDDGNTQFPWNIYFVDPSTKEVTLVGVGIAPNWSPDGTSLIYLAPDGLYQYTLATKSTEKINLDSREQDSRDVVNVDANMNMRVSPDGKTMVVSSPNQQALLFFSIISWEPVTLTLSPTPHRLGEGFRYYWPTFSPDSSHVAAQVTTDAGDGTEVDPRIEIYRLSDSFLLETKRFPEEYDFTHAFIDDWSY